MPRGFTTTQKTALAQTVVSFAYFVDLDLAAGHVRVWNGRGSVTTGGNTYTGIGELGMIDGLENDRSLSAKAISLTLAGLPGSYVTPGIIASTRAVRYQGRPVTIYMGVLDPDTGAIIDSLLPIWTGFADVMSYNLGSSISVTLTAEHYDSLMRRANGARATTESHNQRLGNPSPRDLFFDAADRLMAKAKPIV